MGDVVMLRDQSQARRFLGLIHDELHGYAIFTRYQTGARREGSEVNATTTATSAGPSTRAVRPGTIPRLVTDSHGYDLAVSVCTFTGRRKVKADACQARTLWLDLDVPEGATGQWKEHKRAELEHGRASVVVDSGRGLHAYWLLDAPLDLREGVNAGWLSAANKALAKRFNGDSVSDVSRVMRLPGSVNQKNSAPCRLLDVPAHSFAFSELLRWLEVDAPTEDRTTFDLAEIEAPEAQRRGPGRPRQPIAVKDLRELRRGFRDLIRQGGASNLSRYRKRGTLMPDRSSADMAAVGEMVRCGWSNERIHRVYMREDWRIGDRFRQLAADDGSDRAMDYLARTIAAARDGAHRSRRPNER